MREDYRRHVLDRTACEIRSLLAEIANDTRRYRTIDALTEQIEHQYQGRFLIELLQNAHDAIATGEPTDSGRVRILWEVGEEDADFGTLYVANDGSPFGPENFRAITNLALSNKDPAATIGHKGVGFRSVLEVCDRPEVYSAAERGRFDGYCFRFDPGIREQLASAWAALEANADRIPWPDDLARSLPSDGRAVAVPPGISLREEFGHLSVYALPLPADPARWRPLAELARGGYATAIRLPIRSAVARRTVEARLADIDPEYLLFLDKVSELSVRDGRGERRYAMHAEAGLAPDHPAEVLIESPTGVRHYWRWARMVDAEALRGTLLALPARWHGLREARVRVAVPCEERPLDLGRIFVGLPTEQPSGSAARVDGPFFATDMSRRWIDLAKNPLNALLIGTIADLMADICRSGLRGAGGAGARALVDLLATEVDRIQWPGFPWEEIAETTMVLTQRGWIRPCDARWLPPTAVTRITAATVRARADFPVVDAALDGRRGAWRRLGDVLHGPSPTADADLAAAIEALAPNADPRSEEFWHDVRAWLPESAALRGRRVLPDDAATLWPAADRQFPVFFPPDTEDARGLAAAVPSILRARMAFLTTSLPLLVGTGRDRERTAVRDYLDKLVHDFRREEILQHAVAASPDGATYVAPGTAAATMCAELLAFGTRLVAAAATDNLLAEWRHLRVPCRDGWRHLADTVVGDGWGDPLGDRAAALLDDLGEAEAAGRLLLPRDAADWGGDGALILGWFARLRDLDFPAPRRGFQPQPLPLDDRLHLRKTSPSTLPECRAVRAPVWDAYRQALEPLRGATRPWTVYEPAGLATLPGLDRVAALPAALRIRFAAAVFESVAHWPPGWEQVSFRREAGAVEYCRESFVAWALKTQAWLTAAGGSAACPRDVWYVEQATDEASLSPYQPLRLLAPALAVALRDAQSWPFVQSLGMPRLELDAPANALEFLVQMATLVGREGVSAAAWIHQRPRVRAAWHTLATASAELPSQVLVERGGAAGSWSPDSAERVVIPDDDRGLDLGDDPVMVVGVADAAQLADRLVAAFGASRCVRRSTLRVTPFAGATPWEGQPTAVTSSTRAWIIDVALALVENAQHNPLQSGSERHRRAVAALRGLRVAVVERLHVGVADEAADRRRAVAVLRVGSDVLVDPGGDEAASEFGRALADHLERRDLAGDFAFVFDALGAAALTAPPTDEHLARALRKVRLRLEDLAATRRRLVEDLDWIRSRLAPALRALAVEPGIVASAGSREAMCAILGVPLGPARAVALVEAAAGSPNDREMALSLAWEIPLRQWNDALREVSPDAELITNEAAGEQLRRHVLRAAPCLRRWLVVQLVGHPDRLQPAFQVVDGVSHAVPQELERSIEHWEVPFEVALSLLVRALKAVLDDVLGDTAYVDFAAITDPVSLVRAVDVVASHVPADPRAALNRTLQDCSEVERGVLACVATRTHGAARDALLSKLCAAFVVLAADLPKELDSFLGRTRPATLLQRAAAAVSETDEFRVVLTAMRSSADVADLRRHLGVSDTELVAGTVTVAQLQRLPVSTRLVAGATFPEDVTMLGTLWDHLATNLSLPTGWSVQEAPLSAVVPQSAGHDGRSVGAVRGRGRVVSEAARSLIGLVGEILAYKALTVRFPGLVDPASWVSANRNHRFPDPPGDDALGYDFCVRSGDTTYLIEVKATTGDHLAFQLGPTEVAAARRWAAEPRRRPRTIFRVVYVRRALDRAPPPPLWLPNPFCPRSVAQFRVEPLTSFRVSFDVP